MAEVQRLVHTEKVIGKVSRVFVDFGLNMPISNMAPTARLRDLRLGAGALLDLGVYPLTWVALMLHAHPENRDQDPSLVSSMSIYPGSGDETTTAIFNYPSLHAQGIASFTMLHRTTSEFGRIEGDKGVIILGGVASRPSYLVIKETGKEERKLDFEPEGKGLYWEADAIAEDLRKGVKESAVIPLAESLRMMKLMDKIRADNGLVYPQD